MIKLMLIIKTEEIVNCPHCGRILYKEDEEKGLNFEPFWYILLFFNYCYILAIPYLIFKSKNKKYKK